MTSAPTRTQPAEQSTAKRTETGITTVRALFESPATQDRIRAVLPRHLTPERLLKIALVQISRVPKLANCDPTTLLRCVMQAAELGLDFGSGLGLCYMVPFENRKANKVDVQFIIGYRGLIALARRSGMIDSIEARVVYEGEEFVCEYGIEPVLRHIPKMAGRGKLVAAYAIARMKDGGSHVEVMTRDEIDSIRGRSRAANNGPWVTDYNEMARKTVVRRLCKFLPLSPEEPLAQGLEIDDEYDQAIAEAAAPSTSNADAANRLLDAPEVVDEQHVESTDAAPADQTPPDITAQAPATTTAKPADDGDPPF